MATIFIHTIPSRVSGPYIVSRTFVDQWLTDVVRLRGHPFAVPLTRSDRVVGTVGGFRQDPLTVFAELRLDARVE
ncbi:hypothetical protein Csp2054_06790 [Curtobacterium sp. 'Ferrero']|nr:hypothetical protein Csp2054_06790 [Curtobacterium sp. 'Ferrero']